jgi:hypothetical protein
VSLRLEKGTIYLEGECPVEDAEPLLELLQAEPAARIDWRRCERLHTAVVQVILAAAPDCIGPCGDAFVQQWVRKLR